MKLLTIGDPNLNEVCKKYNCKLDDIYVIADMPKRMIYKKLGLQNVFYIKDINDIEEYKRVLGEIGMKFDKVIMNPPYGKTLPLDIISEVFTYVDFENDGEVICLQPDFLDERITWDKNKPFTKYRGVLEPKLAEVDEADNLFDMQTDHLLIITKYNKMGGFDYDSRSRVNKDIFNKTVKKILDGKQANMRESFNQKQHKYYFAFPAMHGGNGRTYWDEICVKDYNEAIKKETTTSNRYYEMQGMSFKTEKERKNFFNSLFTTFFRYWIIQVKTQKTFNYAHYLPFMGDYTQPWTNERFYKYFNITEEEQKIIEDTMKEYE